MTPNNNQRILTLVTSLLLLLGVLGTGAVLTPGQQIQLDSMETAWVLMQPTTQLNPIFQTATKAAATPNPTATTVRYASPTLPPSRVFPTSTPEIGYTPATYVTAIPQPPIPLAIKAEPLVTYRCANNAPFSSACEKLSGSNWLYISSKVYLSKDNYMCTADNGYYRIKLTTGLWVAWRSIDGKQHWIDLPNGYPEPTFISQFC